MKPFLYHWREEKIFNSLRRTYHYKDHTITDGADCLKNWTEVPWYSTLILDLNERFRDEQYYQYRYCSAIIWPPIPSISVVIAGSQSLILVSVSLAPKQQF